MDSIGWTILMICVQWGIPILYPERMQKGKLTKPLRTLAAKRALKIAEKPTFLTKWDIVRAWYWISLAVVPRLHQIIVLIALNLIVVFGMGIDVPAAYFCGSVIILYLDDYIFGEEDNWKRRWNVVRNKLKWKMELPPQPAQEVA